jgi:hypothetical protein
VYDRRRKKYLGFVLEPYITDVSFSRKVMKLPCTGLVCNGASHSFMRGACRYQELPRLFPPVHLIVTYSEGLLSKLRGGGERCWSNHHHSPHTLLTKGKAINSIPHVHARARTSTILTVSLVSPRSGYHVRDRIDCPALCTPTTTVPAGEPRDSSSALGEVPSGAPHEV